jgi:protocatechuate 3,4-dioxygenase beta subunit
MSRPPALLAVVLAAWLGAVATPATQGPPRATAAAATTGTSAIAGAVVTDETSSRPVRRVTVTLSADGIASRLTVTDDEGRFSFAELAAGRYTLSASRPGFITVAYGARRPGGLGSALPVAAGQQVTGVTLRMLRGAVITGTVRDERGDPVPGVRANVMMYRFDSQTGERTLVSASRGLGDQTDDRGRYRVFGLAPGEYIVLVTQGFGPRGLTDVQPTTAEDVLWATRQLQSGAAAGARAPMPPPAARQPVAYAPVFHPGTTSLSGAALITLAAGEERANVDIPMLMIPTAKITGTVVMPDGSTPPSVSVTLVAQDRIEGLPFSGFSSAGTTAGPFAFPGLAPGVYTVLARVSSRPPPSQPGGALAPVDPALLTLFGMEDVTVSGQDADVTLTMRPGVSVSGRLRFDGSASVPADLSNVSINLSPVAVGRAPTLGVPPIAAQADGTFRFTGVAPGRYRLTSQVPGSTPTSGWHQRRGVVNGQDSLDVPFEVRSADVADAVIVFTDRPASLSGRVQDGSGQPAPEYFIIAFAVDRTFWTPRSRRIQAVRPGRDGRFQMPNLPPGDYFIAAVTDVETGQWYDPAYLQELAAAATKISIGEGEQRVQDFKIGN